MKEKVMCVFGASTTWGAWDLDKGGWANRLRLYIDKGSLEGKHYINVYNLGIDGDSTKSLLKRFENECEVRDPDVIIFSIGDNDSHTDAKGNFDVPLDKFEENVLRLIELSRKFTDKIIFLGIKPIDDSKTQPVAWDKNVNYSNKELEKYGNKIRELCKKENIFYLDISGLLGLDDLEDGVHLNSKGHEKLFNKVKDYLVEKKLI